MRSSTASAKDKLMYPVKDDHGKFTRNKKSVKQQRIV